MSRTLSPLRYPGGKSKLYKFIVNVFRESNLSMPIYVEPFAGGAGLAIELLIKNNVSSIIINDFDSSIYLFWKSILNYTEEFIALLVNTPINIETWKEQKEIYRDPMRFSELEVGFATFYLNRTNRSGIIKGGPISKEQSGKYPIGCRFNKEELIEKIIRIAAMKERIYLYNYDAIHFVNNILPRFPSEELFIFFDPPYYRQGKNLYTNFYSHDDHKELSSVIKGLENISWITTYDYDPNIEKMYTGVPKKVYQIQYSANKKRKEKEFLFHSSNLTINSFENVVFV